MKEISIQGKITRIKWKINLRYGKKVYIAKKVHVYMLHQLNPLLETNLFLARSTFLPAQASLWPERSVEAM